MSSSWTRGSLAGIERWPATTRRRCGRPSGTSIRAGTLVQFNLPLLLACCCSGTECSCVESARKLYFHRENWEVLCSSTAVTNAAQLLLMSRFIPTALELYTFLWNCELISGQPSII
jgi:hypothetical protein